MSLDSTFSRRARLLVPRLPRVPLQALLASWRLVVLGGGWLWLRDSSLVAGRARSRSSGSSSSEAAQVRAALEAAARDMTTLHVARGRPARRRRALPVRRRPARPDRLPAPDAHRGDRARADRRGRWPATSSPVGAGLPDARRRADEQAARLCMRRRRPPATASTDAETPRRAGRRRRRARAAAPRVERIWTGPEGPDARAARGPELFFGDVRDARPQVDGDRPRARRAERRRGRLPRRPGARARGRGRARPGAPEDPGRPLTATPDRSTLNRR